VPSASTGRQKLPYAAARQVYGQPAHSASQADFRQPAPPGYASSTAGSASRQRPKSASVSRPPRPR
jgi:hypothetical protein